MNHPKTLLILTHRSLHSLFFCNLSSRSALSLSLSSSSSLSLVVSRVARLMATALPSLKTVVWCQTEGRWTYKLLSVFLPIFLTIRLHLFFFQIFWACLLKVGASHSSMSERWGEMWEDTVTQQEPVRPLERDCLLASGHCWQHLGTTTELGRPLTHALPRNVTRRATQNYICVAFDNNDDIKR